MRKTFGVVALLVALTGTAVAEQRTGSVQVPIVDESGAPVYCTRADTAGHGRPDGYGGYRLESLRPGRWIIRLDLPYEHVDVVVTATAGEHVVVPPVVARGRCKSIAVNRQMDLRQLVIARPASWSVSFDRSYAAHAAAPRPLLTRLRRGYVMRPKVPTHPDPVIAGAPTGF